MNDGKRIFFFFFNFVESGAMLEESDMII